jgi:V8-like Glu-specific endopeptidase
MAVELETQDLNAIVNTLAQLDIWLDAPSRRAVVSQAGLKKLIPKINFGGTNEIFLVNLVDFLARYGHINYDNEALGLFLNAMTDKFGVDQDIFSKLVVKYHMMEPVAPRQPMGEWKSDESATTTLEKIFGENTLRPIAFLARGLEVAKSVALIRVQSAQGSWLGTGFMVTPKLALTNHHVIQDANLLPGVTLRFNYQQDILGRDQPYTDHPADPHGFFCANKELDYALFEVKDEPGQDWGYLPLKARNIAMNDRVNLVEHPAGGPKQISMQNNMVQAVGGNVLQYVTSTLPGSSGSPVFNDNWEVVGLHHSGGLLADPNTKNYFNRNEGILIGKILGNLPPDAQQALSTAADNAG